jgi:hypothetical protein
VQVSQVFAVELRIVPYGHEPMQALLYKIPVKQDLHK